MQGIWYTWHDCVFNEDWSKGPCDAELTIEIQYKEKKYSSRIRFPMHTYRYHDYCALKHDLLRNQPGIWENLDGTLSVRFHSNGFNGIYNLPLKVEEQDSVFQRLQAVERENKELREFLLAETAKNDVLRMEMYQEIKRLQKKVQEFGETSVSSENKETEQIQINYDPEVNRRYKQLVIDLQNIRSLTEQSLDEFIQITKQYPFAYVTQGKQDTMTLTKLIKHHPTELTMRLAKHLTETTLFEHPWTTYSSYNI